MRALAALQAEQFANELTRHLDIAAPDCRIVRQVRRGMPRSATLCHALSPPNHSINIGYISNPRMPDSAYPQR